MNTGQTREEKSRISDSQSLFPKGEGKAIPYECDL